MADGLAIAFFGSSLVSSWWNGACTYYRGLIRGLNARGHHITFFEPDAFGRQQHRDIETPEYAEVVVYPADSPSEVLRAVGRAEGADVVVKTSGVGVFDELLEEAVSTIAPSGTFRVFWDVDAPATLARLEADPDDPLRSLLPRYDLVLTYGGGEPVLRRYTALGARACSIIYNGLDPSTHHRVDSDPRYVADCGLLANRLPDREERIGEFFFRAAALLPQKTFLLGGNGWDEDAMLRNVRLVGHVPTADHNAFNSTPTTMLNVTRESMAANGWSPPTRVFEAAGAGACLVTDAWAGIGDFFHVGTEVLVARDGQEVADFVDSLTPATAAGIGERARRRALDHHTYDVRAALVDEVLRTHMSART